MAIRHQRARSPRAGGAGHVARGASQAHDSPSALARMRFMLAPARSASSSCEPCGPTWLPGVAESGLRAAAALPGTRAGEEGGAPPPLHIALRAKSEGSGREFTALLFINVAAIERRSARGEERLHTYLKRVGAAI